MSTASKEGENTSSRQKPFRLTLITVRSGKTFKLTKLFSKFSVPFVNFCEITTFLWKYRQRTNQHKARHKENVRKGYLDHSSLHMAKSTSRTVARVLGVLY